ncbi:MAG: hypothetical protein Q9178_005516 [Gyalolechia marmorata]
MGDSLDHMASGRTRIEWTSGLNTEYKPQKEYRRTSIICTIGPKTNSAAKINQLRKAGLNVVRMNFSHGAYEYHQSVIDNAREAERLEPGRPLAIALDTKGPEIRTGNTKGDEDIPIAQGAEINITTDEKYATACDDKNMYVDYKNITKVIEKGRTIYVDDGVLSFEVLEVVDDKTVRAKCMNNGKISSKKGVNLPKTDVDLPALSEKDKNDLRFGVKNRVDMVFASFIRRGSDITSIREVLGEEGKEIQIIAKIENQQGVNNFDEILKETDGVMVARGDLGIEIPPAQVFIAQKMMIAKCNRAGKPVICATQMLESMTYNPRPTRAEVSDVGNAVLDGADCVMLSGETAKGNYPKESVQMMHETCAIAEVAIPYISLYNDLRAVVEKPISQMEATATSAVSSSMELNAGAILVLTTSGSSARMLSKYRPICPIIMVTRNATASRYSHLYRGVYPFLFPEEKPDFKSADWQQDVDRRLKWGISEAIKLGILSKGDPVVCVQGWRGGKGHTNTTRIVPAEEDLGLSHEEFDKGSYLYLYRNIGDHGGRVEIANNVGKPEQDAFTGAADATTFVDSIGKSLEPGQLEILDKPLAPAAHENLMSPVVQKLENVAVEDSAYQNGQTRSSRSTVPVFSPPPTASSESRQDMPRSNGPENFKPLAYNPAAPPAPEPIKHREKTPPPPEAETEGTGLSAAAYNDHHQSPAVSPLSHPGHGSIPQPPYPSSMRSSAYSSPQPHGSPYNSPPPFAGLSGMSPAPSGRVGSMSSLPPPPPQGARTPSVASAQAPYMPPSTQLTSLQPSFGAPPRDPNAFNLAGNKPLDSPTAQILGNSYVGPPPQPLQHLQPQYADYLATRPQHQHAPQGQAHDPSSGYSDHNHGQHHQHHHHSHQHGSEYDVHNQIYRPTEDETQRHKHHRPSDGGQSSGKLEPQTGKLDKGVNRLFKKLEKRIG